MEPEDETNLEDRAKRRKECKIQITLLKLLDKTMP